ncbi:MAG: hypothetical protein JST92_22655, partial [Deltaproteobacteria bacterium]|nr:hypothetical protein [Deltaproteobacteria bacterium]
PASDLGNSEIAVDVRIDTTVTSAGAATVQLQLVTADDQGLTTNLTVIQQTDAIAKAALVKGYRFLLGKLPPGLARRFLGVRYVIGTAALTAGTASASLVLNPIP